MKLYSTKRYVISYERKHDLLLCSIYNRRSGCLIGSEVVRHKGINKLPVHRKIMIQRHLLRKLRHKIQY